MYKCIRPITIYPNVHVHYDDAITSETYNSLDWVEKQHFTQVGEDNIDDEPKDSEINLLDAAIDIASIGISVASIFGDSTSNDSPLDDTSFGGFDGGDFGGGGAGGDF